MATWQRSAVRTGRAVAFCALVIACGCVSSWRQQVAAARDDLDPSAVAASGAAPDGDVLWVGRCIGPVPAMPWYDELEWIPGPWRELRIDADSRGARLPHGTAAALARNSPSSRFFVARSLDADERRPDDPRPGLQPGEWYACVGRASAHAGAVVLWFSRPPLRVVPESDPPQVGGAGPAAAPPAPGGG
jgi:hypothetical protein